MAKAKSAQRTLTAAERQARIARAREREKQEHERREHASFVKKVFTVAVCVILALALSIPTMALVVMGGNG